MEEFGVSMRTARGRKGEKERGRGKEADKERGTQESFDGVPGRAGAAPIAAVQLGQKLAEDMEREGGNPRFHVCANVLSGTLPGPLLI